MSSRGTGGGEKGKEGHKSFSQMASPSHIPCYLGDQGGGKKGGKGGGKKEKGHSLTDPAHTIRVHGDVSPSKKFPLPPETRIQGEEKKRKRKGGRNDRPPSVVTLNGALFGEAVWQKGEKGGGGGVRE